MITPEDKDALLRYLCEKNRPEKVYRLSLIEMRQATSLPVDTIEALLSYFNRIKLIQHVAGSSSSVKPTADILVTIEALDIIRRGGFTFQEQILQKEIENLSLEVERLRPSLGDKIEQISTIAANLMSLIKPF
jgi:hypothetical protein